LGWLFVTAYVANASISHIVGAGLILTGMSDWKPVLSWKQTNTTTPKKRKVTKLFENETFFCMNTVYNMTKTKQYSPEYYHANKERFKLYAQRYAAKKLSINNGTYIADKDTVKKTTKSAYEHALLRYAKMERLHLEKREKSPRVQ
jgi:hypothetical protein